MKICVNDKEICTLSETQKKVIRNDVPGDAFDADMERRVHYIIMHKYEQCLKRLKEEWDPKLAQRVDAVPTDPEKYAELVFAQKDYMDRSAREKIVAEAADIE